MLHTGLVSALTGLIGWTKLLISFRNLTFCSTSRYNATA